MRKFQITLLLLTLTAAPIILADAPIVDAYQQGDSGNQPSAAVASPMNDDDNRASLQPSGIDLSQSSTPRNNANSNSSSSATPNTANLPMDQRVVILERQAANTTQLLSQINNLQQQVQDLRGQLDTQNHNVEVMQEQLRTQYKDLDQRLSKASSSSSDTKSTLAAAPAKATKVAAVNKTASKPSASTADNATATAKTSSSDTTGKTAADNSGDNTSSLAASSESDDTRPAVAPPAPAVVKTKDQNEYQAAFNLLRDKKYDQAVSAFQAYLTSYPKAKNSINAHYWLGQLYLLQSQPDQAINEFKTILATSPSGSKIPDTMVQLGLAYYASGDLQHAKQQLAQVQQAYPDSPAARLAKTRLQQISQASKTSPAAAG